jgi:hypothetical protein
MKNMSLTSFIKNKDVKDTFKQEFKKPQLKLQAELLAPPLTTNYGLVGTAFDYLLRFYIKRLNPDAVEQHWASELSLDFLALIQQYGSSDISDEDPVMRKLNETKTKNPALADPIIYKKALEIVQYAKNVYNRYLNTGKMEHDLFKAVLLLAQVDVIYRAGLVYENFGSVDENDIKDLQNLISIVRPEYFKAKKICVLNPAFGKASELIGGADCDLVIDDAIIDIKTTKKLDFRRDYFNQLIGYYTLYKIGGIDDASPDVEIKRLGIYFSRYGYLYFIDVQNIIREDAFLHFVEWFKKRAGKEYGLHI